MTDKSFKSIVVLTGAGISAESGIQTFRDQNGLWENHRIEDVASLQGFYRNPMLVHDFYNQRRQQLLRPEIKPNLAHLALAQFEKTFTGDFLLVTQNVDNLHERAGSKNVLHMHGELLKVRCQKTNKILNDIPNTHVTLACPVCLNTGCLRPHIVWFGEIPLEMERIQQAIRTCDLFVAIGTSAVVYPAAQFIQWARSWNKAHTVEINLQETPASDLFHETVLGPAGIEVPAYLKRIS
jgi:NAD-dependent deacetylase